MKTNRLVFLLATLFSLAILTACGGGSADTPTSASTSGATWGVAVDPYISGAHFQEIGPDGNVIQETHVPSDINGRFTFTRAMTPGSTIAMKIGSLALHNGTAYQGMLKRTIAEGEAGVVTVSPLTTLLASGLAPQQVLAALETAGIGGLTAADLTANPMAKVEDAGSQVVDADLKLLQANMAINAFIEKIIDEAKGEQGFDHGAFNARLEEIDTPENTELLGTLATAMGDSLNASRLSYGSVKDMIAKAVEINQAVATLIRENRDSDMTTIRQKIIDAVRQELAKAEEGGPAPVDAQAVFDAECAGCHAMGNYDTAGSPDLAGKGSQIAAKIQGGHMAKSLTAEELAALAAWVDGVTAPAPTPSPTPAPGPQPGPVDGQALFDSKCSTCHNLSGDGSLFDLSADGAKVSNKFTADVAGHQGKTLTAEEIQAIADYFDGTQAPAPAPNPDPNPQPTPVDGNALYGSNCSGCHGNLDNTTVQNRTAAGIQAAIDGNLGNMGFLTLATEEVQAIAEALSAAPAPAPIPVDGPAIYDSRCAGCHKLGAVDTAGGPDLAGLGNAAITKIEGGHNGVTLTTDELNALADYVDTVQAPAPPPVPVPVDGPTVYANSCAGCHKLGAVDPAGNLDLAGLGNAAIAKIEGGHNGVTLTTDELNALADYLDTFTPPVDPGPDYSSCTACHGQPPTGTNAGAHAAHVALPSVGTNCSVCHQGASHNDNLDLAFAPTWNAKSGTATDNLDGTCSNISCHGGQTTPDWWTGTIAVNSACTDCHSSGTGQYNGYFSGRHSKHLNKGIGCTSCHDTGKLANNHFTKLETSTMEGPAGNTMKNAMNYNGSSCNPSCHSSESW